MNKITKSDLQILLVEDEVNLLEAMHFSLRRAGYTVFKANSGLEALSIVKSRHAAGASIDLLVTDIQMPGMGGEELIREVRAIDATMPVIVSTGFGEKELLVRLLRLGCRDFIEKPFKASQIEERVEMLFDASYRDVLEKKRQEHLARIGEKARALIHDIKNVLGGAVEHAGMVLGEVGESHPVRKKLEKIFASANLVSDICRNLLAPGGPAGSEKVRTEVRALVERIAEVLRSIAPDSVVVETKAPGTPVWLDADAERLQQALLHCGINALGAMQRGGILTYKISTVTASRSAKIAPEQCVRIAVSDTGAAAENVSQPAPGRGYGLQTVQTIVEEHDGWIETAGERGERPEIRLYFPV